MATYPERSRRDLGVTALIEGFFAAAWFGWGTSHASPGLATLLNIGSILGVIVAIVGAVIGFRSPRSTAVLHDPASGRRYGILVGIEFALAGIGSAILGVTGQSEYIPVWVCAVVGVHFFPLAPILRSSRLPIIGALLCAVAIAGLIVALATTTFASTIVGPGAGIVLLVFGALAMIDAIRTPGESTPGPADDNAERAAAR